MRRAVATVVAVAGVALAAVAVGVAFRPLATAPPFLDDGTDGDGPVGADAGPAESERAYAASVEGVEACGTTCREVTATLTNRADRPRESVTVVTRLYADGDLLWESSEHVGRLGADETHTTTERVELDYADALAVQSNDGYVTVERTVRSDGGTTTVAERRRVE